MAVELHVTFAGMCLLVHDAVRRDRKKLLHALLPATGVQHHAMGGPVDRHLARLLYDVGHETDGGAINGNFRMHQLENGEIDLSGLTATPELVPPPDGVVDLGAIVNTRVSRSLFESANPGERVVARVTLGAGSVTIPDEAKGGKWTLGGKTERMAIRVEWTLQVTTDDGFLDLTITGINGDVPRKLPRLFASGGKIHLWVFHVPKDQLPEKLSDIGKPKGNGIGKGDKAPHFAAFYTTIDPPLPIFEPDQAGEATNQHRSAEEPTEGSLKAASSAMASAAAGTEFTCMVARAPADPQP